MRHSIGLLSERPKSERTEHDPEILSKSGCCSAKEPQAQQSKRIWRQNCPKRGAKADRLHGGYDRPIHSGRKPDPPRFRSARLTGIPLLVSPLCLSSAARLSKLGRDFADFLLTFLRRQLKSYCAQVLDSKRHHLSTGAVRCQKSQQRSACICSDRAPGRASALPRVRRHRAGVPRASTLRCGVRCSPGPAASRCCARGRYPSGQCSPVRAAPHR
jgi:hypothetical protein